MSDTDYSVVPRNSNLQNVDRDWVEDCLSDDEIELPKEHQIIDEEDDIALGDELGVSIEPSSDEIWSDFGLERFINEQKRKT